MRASWKPNTERNGRGLTLLLAMLVTLGVAAHLPGFFVDRAGVDHATVIAGTGGTDQDVQHQQGDDQAARPRASTTTAAVHVRPLHDREADAGTASPSGPTTTVATAGSAAAHPDSGPWRSDPRRGPPSA